MDFYKNSKWFYDSYKDLVKIISSKISSNTAFETFIVIIKEPIEPFNIAELLNASFKNMYRRTIVMV